MTSRDPESPPLHYAQHHLQTQVNTSLRPPNIFHRKSHRKKTELSALATMPRMPKFTPYGARPRRPAQLILGWVLVLVLIFALTVYLTKRDGEPSKIDTKVVLEKIRSGGGSLREKTSKVVL
ncbi:hypothetical protein HD806DRAFT_531276 [Xylariaceae sp. AK1471]|nr:hypothetical protein HD806DRAFT_531276 [Xylariaceae sp. AK1471]